MDLRLTSKRQPALVLGVGLVALALFAGRASADASQYPSPLYLSGTASGTLATSYQLVTSKGASANAAGSPSWGLTWGVASPQIALVGVSGGTGSLGAGGAESYSYRYTIVDANGETVPSVASNTVTANKQNITVSGLPTGVTVRLYRLNSVGAYKLVTQLTNNSSSTYADSTADGSVGAVVPQAQNRTNLSSGGAATGWYDYSPGAALSNPNVTSGNTNPSTPAAAAAFNGKGWLLDAAGGVGFAAGTWQFTTKLASSGSTAFTAGTAHLAVGMWLVDSSGAVDPSNPSPLIDPTCATTPCGENSVPNIALGSGTSSAIVSSFSVPSFTVPSGDHLYVQYFRHQTAAAVSGNTISTLNAYDGVAAITHPAASTLPNTPTPVTPVSGGYVSSAALTATFTDPDVSDTGTITFQVCSESGCSSVLASGTASAVGNGASGSWTPTSLTSGTTYYWRAKASDGTGESGWSATQSFTFDTTPPETSIATRPATSTNSTSATFTFTSNESGSSFECRLDGGSYGACVSPKSYNGLSNASHTFEVRATDQAGNTDATPDSATWTVDATSPVSTITTSPANTTNATSASFAFGASKAGATFQCAVDGASYAACTTPAAYSGLASGTHTFQLRATDAVGNLGSASYSWTIDTSAPDTTIAGGPAPSTSSTGASFGFLSSKSGSTFRCSLDGAGFAACTSPVSFSGLVDGSHTFQVEAVDLVGNVDSSPASSQWTVDTTPPETTIGDRPLDPTSATSAGFAFASSEDGSTFRCSLDGAAFAACTSPASFSGLAEGGHTFQVEAADALGNQDATPASASWTVDTTPPSAPGALTGTTGAAGLTLSWAPADGGPIGAYVLYVNGAASTRIDGSTTSATIGDFADGDTRTFAVSAVDGAQNEGPQSVTLTAVPNVLGLAASAANATLESHGLGRETSTASDTGGVVVSQTPSAGKLVAVQSLVVLTYGGTAPAATTGSKLSGSSVSGLAVNVAGSQKVSCKQASRLAVHIRLDRKADVNVRFLTTAGAPVAALTLRRVNAGSRTVTLRLPSVLTKGKSYRMVVTAKVEGRLVRAQITLTIARADGRTAASASRCG